MCVPGGNFHPSWKLGESNAEKRKRESRGRLMSKYNYGLRNTGLAGQGSQVQTSSEAVPKFLRSRTSPPFPAALSHLLNWLRHENEAA